MLLLRHISTLQDHRQVDTFTQLLHCLSLSSCQLEWTPPTAQLLLSQSQQGDLVGHPLRLSSVLVRISRPNCEPLYATNTSHREQETFLCAYPLQWVLLPPLKKKTHTRTSLFGIMFLKHGHHFDCWNQPLNIRMHICYLVFLFWRNHIYIYIYKWPRPAFLKLFWSGDHFRKSEQFCGPPYSCPLRKQIYHFLAYFNTSILIS
jgi:hypothetical protein